MDFAALGQEGTHRLPAARQPAAFRTRQLEARGAAAATRWQPLVPFAGSDHRLRGGPAPLREGGRGCGGAKALAAIAAQADSLDRRCARQARRQRRRAPSASWRCARSATSATCRPRCATGSASPPATIPLFSWWTADPYRRANDAMTKYAKALREVVVGQKEGEEEPIIGDPIGRPRRVEADLEARDDRLHPRGADRARRARVRLDRGASRRRPRARWASATTGARRSSR